MAAFGDQGERSLEDDECAESNGKKSEPLATVGGIEVSRRLARSRASRTVVASRILDHRFGSQFYKQARVSCRVGVGACWPSLRRCVRRSAVCILLMHSVDVSDKGKMYFAPPWDEKDFFFFRLFGERVRVAGGGATCGTRSSPICVRTDCFFAAVQCTCNIKDTPFDRESRRHRYQVTRCVLSCCR